jgi:hypothetical protein
MTANAAPSLRTNAERYNAERYFVWLAGASVIIAFGGFFSTYWAPVATGTFTGRPVLHVHGILFSAWTIFFLTQATLAASGRVERHRALGLFGIALAAAMVFVGLWTAISGVQADATASFAEQARRFAIVPISGITLFAVFVGFAIANVRRPNVHMRLMVLATIGILQAAVARVVRAVIAPDAPLPGQGPPPPIVTTYTAAVIVDLLLLAAIAFDWKTRGRPHPVYLIGGAALLLVQFSRGPLSETPAWQAIIAWLLALVG